MATIPNSKFSDLKKNLYQMAEASLEQIILLLDAFEKADLALCETIIERDDEIDFLEKENDNLSQTAILEAAAVTNQDKAASNWSSLPFGLSAIRFTRNFERIGDQVVNCAKSMARGKLTAGFFAADTTFRQIAKRVTTIVGMAVESLVEEKRQLIGNILAVENEIDSLCEQAFKEFVADESLTRLQFADSYRIILAMERIGDLAVNIAEELYRLNTGQDIRHSSDFNPELVKEVMPVDEFLS